MTSRAWFGGLVAAPTALALSASVAAFLAGWDGRVTAQDTPCLAATTSGDVAGVRRGGVCAYLGVPYAAPPTGTLRWKPPQPRAPWGPAPLDATVAAQNCAQIAPAAGALPAGVEDCLTLNIWTPAVASSRRGVPVIVWLHTGGFQATSSNFAAHNGQRFANERGAIVVAPNYRLGAFGFLANSALTQEDPNYASSGNYGLADQRAALWWVRNNIAAFGGDPDNVTIAGTSAGATSVGMHVMSPASHGLFHRAIIQSGYASIRWPTLAEAESQGERFAVALGCTDRARQAACMRSASFDQVLRALPVGQLEVREVEGRVIWTPVVDGLEIPEQPRDAYRRGQFSRVPVIIGVNGDEGWSFVDRSYPSGLDALQYEMAVRSEFGMDAAAILSLYPATAYATPKDALARLIADAEFICEARRVARFLHHNGAPVYFYSFEYGLDDVASSRVLHGLESNFVFGNDFAVAPNLGIFAPRALTAADTVLYGAMSSYWREFAKTGSPNVPGTPVPWPVFESDLFGAPRVPALADRYLRFDRIISEDSYLRDSQCNFWEHFYFRSAVIAVPAAAR